MHEIDRLGRSFSWEGLRLFKSEKTRGREDERTSDRALITDGTAHSITRLLVFSSSRLLLLRPIEIEEIHDPGFQGVLGANDAEPVALNEAFENFRPMTEMIG